MRWVIFSCALVLLFAPVTSARAQCDQLGGWSTEFDLPYLDDRIAAYTEFQGSLVVGGQFNEAGGVALPHVARLIDGTWQAMGSLPGEVDAFCVFKNTLYAGGRFSNGSLYRWSGNAWELVTLPYDAGVNALRVYGNSLALGGRFSNGATIAGVLLWDGVSWTPLSGDPGPYGYQFLAIFRGDLVASDSNGKIFSWNGAAWNQIGETGISLTGLESFGDYLFAGGWSQLLRFDGQTWEVPPGVYVGYIRAIKSFGNQLWVGGSLFLEDSNGGAGAWAVRWDGSSWSAMGSNATEDVVGFDVVNGDSLMIGRLSDQGGEVSRWTGANWQSVINHPPRFKGITGWPMCMTEWNGKVIVGGQLSQTGALKVCNIASWDGNEWNALGAGMPAPVRDLALFRGQLAVWADNDSGADSIALWNGSQWSPIPFPFNHIEKLYQYQDDLIATIVLPDYPLRSILRWDGGTWKMIARRVRGEVDAMFEYDGALYVGGEFSSIEGIPETSGLARWDGQTWSSVGGVYYRHPTEGMLTPGGITTFTEYNHELIAGGFFARAGGIDVNGLAAFDGQSWHPVAGGLPDPYPEQHRTFWVWSLASYKGDLIAGGTTRWYGDDKWFVRLHGNTWCQYDAPPDLTGMMVADGQGHLYMAGGVSKVGTVKSYRFASWGEPWFPLAGTDPEEPLQEKPSNAMYLIGAYPNPFLVSSTIRFHVPGDSHVEAWLFDVHGARVAHPFSGDISKGYQQITWDGRNERGARVSSGVYVLQLASGFGSKAVRLIKTQ